MIIITVLLIVTEIIRGWWLILPHPDETLELRRHSRDAGNNRDGGGAGVARTLVAMVTTAGAAPCPISVSYPRDMNQLTSAAS